MKHSSFFTAPVYSLFFLLAALFFVPQMVSAQAAGEALFFEDDEAEEAEDLSKYDEVLIMVDGEAFDINQDDLEFEKNSILAVQVRHLRPNSTIVVSLKKAGMKLTRKSYQANEKGELDLEVKTGNKKIKGQATLFYSPGNNERKERTVKVKVI